MIGYSAFNSDGITWRNHQGGALPISPGKKLKNIDSDSVKRLRAEKGLAFARWEREFDVNNVTEWWHIIKDDDCDIQKLSSNTRSKVRRGLKAFRCELVSREVILEEGFEVYKKASSRYETHEKCYSREEFLAAVKSLPTNTEFWGVRSQEAGQLVAFSENFVEDKTCFYNTIWFEPESLRKYSSYALFFEMGTYYLESKGFDYVSDGARSLSHDTQIHDFLESKFGFRKAYSTLNVVYAPWLKALISVCYPLKNLINRVPFTPFQKASILLKQEDIRRRCKQANG